MLLRIRSIALALVSVTTALMAQQGLSNNPVQPGVLESAQEKSTIVPESKRLFGIIPNYRTSDDLHHFEPLTAGKKFKMASEDALDRGTFVLAAILAGQSQAANDNRSFGHGAAGFGRYFGAASADLVIGDYLTEGVFPILLGEDPRYLRRGTGSTGSRIRYALRQSFVTHRDSGGMQINCSELLGNASAVAISNAYYKDNRTALDAFSKFGMQIGLDTATNVLKEFWPDVAPKFRRKP